jgi:hypothetical protein
VSKFQSLAEFLGEAEPRQEDPSAQAEDSSLRDDVFDLEKLTGPEFADALLNSVVFRRYIIRSMQLGTLPATVVTRLMDYAPGWGKPPERVEHTGKDGKPIETVTIVRRVVVRPTDLEEEEAPKYQTH